MEAARMASPRSYRLIFENRSTRAGSVCLYQAAPALGPADARPLAWLTRYTHPTTRVTLSWQLEYCFFWRQRKTFRGRSTLSQTWPADLERSNELTLSYDRTYRFRAAKAGANPGRLTLRAERTLPPGQAWAGIGLSGAPLFAVPVQPNLSYVFTPPSPIYWITFGTCRSGEALDLERITNPARLELPPNVHTLRATLELDNTWSVEPCSRRSSLADARGSGGPQSRKLTPSRPPTS
jgi:hypothetical protein